MWATSSADETYFVKLANYDSETQELTVPISGLGSAKLTVVGSDDEGAANTDTETTITPADSTPSATDGKFSFTMPARSIAVLVAK